MLIDFHYHLADATRVQDCWRTWTNPVSTDPAHGRPTDAWWTTGNADSPQPAGGQGGEGHADRLLGNVYIDPARRTPWTP